MSAALVYHWRVDTSLLPHASARNVQRHDALVLDVGQSVAPSFHGVSSVCSHVHLVHTPRYFVHDTIDMLKYEVSRWTFELLLHHVATTFILESSVLSKKFILYAYWALLMEVNRCAAMIP